MNNLTLNPAAARLTHKVSTRTAIRARMQRNFSQSAKKTSPCACSSGFNPYLCSAYHLIQATWIADFAAGIFYAQRQPHSSDPRVESLMASLPVLGVVQRESGTFFVPFPSYSQPHCFI